MSRLMASELLKYEDSTIYTLWKKNKNGEFDVWSINYSIDGLIKSIKKINTIYDSEYLIEERQVRFLHSDMFDIDYNKVKIEIKNIKDELKIKGLPDLKIALKGKVINTEELINKLRTTK